MYRLLLISALLAPGAFGSASPVSAANGIYLVEIRSIECDSADPPLCELDVSVLETFKSPRVMTQGPLQTRVRRMPPGRIDSNPDLWHPRMPKPGSRFIVFTEARAGGVDRFRGDDVFRILPATETTLGDIRAAQGVLRDPEPLRAALSTLETTFNWGSLYASTAWDIVRSSVGGDVVFDRLCAAIDQGKGTPEGRAELLSRIYLDYAIMQPDLPEAHAQGLGRTLAKVLSEGESSVHPAAVAPMAFLLRSRPQDVTIPPGTRSRMIKNLRTIGGGGARELAARLARQ